jgi:hypothetical protein
MSAFRVLLSRNDEVLTGEPLQRGGFPLFPERPLAAVEAMTA